MNPLYYPSDNPKDYLHYQSGKGFGSLHRYAFHVIIKTVKRNGFNKFVYTNKRLRGICNDEAFWKDRSLRDYSMGPSVDYKIGSRLIPNYKQYYIDREPK